MCHGREIVCRAQCLTIPRRRIICVSDRPLPSRTPQDSLPAATEIFAFRFGVFRRSSVSVRLHYSTSPLNARARMERLAIEPEWKDEKK